MGQTSEKVDAYIAKAKPFAGPILNHLRALAHQAEPEASESTRWGMPYWILEDRQLCGMASFTEHCVFVVDGPGGGEAMGDLGRITSLEGLPTDAEIIAMIRDKAARIRSGEDTKAASQSKPMPAVDTPDDLASALAETSNAEAVFAGLTDAQRRDYIEWITSAKREATRAKRIATAAEWIGEGKRRNWKYEKC